MPHARDNVSSQGHDFVNAAKDAINTLTRDDGVGPVDNRHNLVRALSIRVHLRDCTKEPRDGASGIVVQEVVR